MASVYDEIDVKDEPLFLSLEYDQVCSVFYNPNVYYRFHIPNLSLVYFVYEKCKKKSH